MAETNNTTSNTTAADENKLGVSKKRLKNTKVNDEIVKGGVAMTGSPIDKIEMNPVQESAEHTAVTNLNMRAQPVHKGHVKVIRAVEAEAKRVGGSAHVVTSHSEEDEKNPIPTSKKVGYLKKVALPSTHVSSTSREAPSIIDTAARLNRHAHHLVVVAGADRADEYEKLLHRYNGKPDKSGKIHYNFKSITVKKIDRDPDAEGTKGISGTKMREYAKNGNISAFKSGLPTELHKHAEEMMSDINKASKKKVKEDIDDIFSQTFIDTNDTVSVLEAIDAAHREAIPRSGDRKKIQFVARKDQDRKKSAVPYRQDAIQTNVNEAGLPNTSDYTPSMFKDKSTSSTSTTKLPNTKDYNPSMFNKSTSTTKLPNTKDYTPSMFKSEAKKPKSGWDRIWNPKTISGRKMIAASDEAQKAADALKAAAKQKTNEAFEQIDEISKELVGRVNKLRTLGPDIMKGTPPKPHKTEAGYKTLKNAVDKAAGVKKTGEYKLPKVEEAKRLNRDVRTEAKAPEWDEKEFNLVRSGMWRHHTGDSSIHYGGDSKSYTVMHGNDRDPVKYRTLDGAQKAVRAKLKEDKKMYKCPECGAPVEKKGMNCGACHENMKEEVVQEKRGLWDNIWAKRKRIKNGSGEHMRKPGSKGAPTNKDFKDSQ